MRDFHQDILMTRVSGRIALTLRAVFMGCDLCVMLTGGDTPHLGALTAASKAQAPQTIAFEGHQEHHVTEMAAARLRESYDGNVAVCCGIHLDRIEKWEIGEVMAMTADMTDELCRRLKENSQA